MKKIKLFIYTILAFGLIAGNCLAGDFSDIDIHGFLSQGYLDTTDNNFFGDTEGGTFDFDEVGVNFGKDFSDKLHVGFQLLARDFGANGNNELDIDWAFADYHMKDWLGFRAGKLKAPKGLYNETRDVDMLRTTIFLPQSVYPEILREVDLSIEGYGAYGFVGLGDMGGISYQVLFGDNDIDPNEAASQAIQGTTATSTPVENDGIEIKDKLIFALVWDTPLSGLRMGATYDYTENLFAPAHFTAGGMWDEGESSDTDFKKYSNVVVSAEYTIGSLIVAAEYIQTEKEFVHIFGGVSGAPEGMTSDGWYLSSSYQFTDWFALGSYYSETYNDLDDRDGAGIAGDDMSDTVYHRAYFKDFCLTTAFTLDYSWTLKLEGHLFNGTNGVSPLDQVADENGDVFAEEDWGLFAAKITYSF
jgi:hypothetical protein